MSNETWWWAIAVIVSTTALYILYHVAMNLKHLAQANIAVAVATRDLVAIEKQRLAIEDRAERRTIGG